MNKYSKFLFSMTKIGCIGFGGGSALIPVIEEEIIDEQKIDTKENLDKRCCCGKYYTGSTSHRNRNIFRKKKFWKQRDGNGSAGDGNAGRCHYRTSSHFVVNSTV